MTRLHRLAFLDGLGGTYQGSFFKPGPEVHTDKPPGASNVYSPKDLSEVIYNIVTGQAFFFSPNLSWFVIACITWLLAPYNYESTGNSEESFAWYQHLSERLLVNHVLALGYVGFWHMALYWWKWAKRPFVKDRVYNWNRVGHNIFYSWLGLLQWSVTETLFLFGYHTQRIPFHNDKSIYDSPTLAIGTCLACILLPNFRDVHFYFAHRLIHTQFLYKYIHSLHHRNTDTEPFSGLCMHPVEHMYYFSCYAPLLIYKFHPFVLSWMGIHLLLSPAASHSGYEDHFSADLAHYLHHQHADCNYGVPQSIPLDQWFGTFRDHLQPKHRPLTTDPKARLWDLSFRTSWEQLSYNGGCLVLWWVVWQSATATGMIQLSPILGAFVASVGPALLALGMVILLRTIKRTSGGPIQRSLLAPLDKDPFWSSLLHLSLGILLGMLPVTYLIYLVLRGQPQIL